MVMKVQPLQAAVEGAKTTGAARTRRWFNESSREEILQTDVAQFKAAAGLILARGRYEGVDERFVQRCIDLEWSIGDYVLTGVSCRRWWSWMPLQGICQGR
ncbi:MAG: hypothetical protein CM15mP120_21470 [Pseudomonadota bacterium]|nr:MAG: hypothetical protein CM15mP120_21470 [Pseudomonadota bacterium]